MTLWFLDWMWCFPLIVLSVVIHVAGLGLISEKVVQPLSALAQNRRFTVSFVIIMGVVAWLVTALHALEGFAWALAYRLLGAVGDMTDAVLYSFSAMTAYGHASVVLERRWQLMGALEALNGLMLFGLTTAFMFAMIGRVGRRRPGRGLTRPGAAMAFLPSNDGGDDVRPQCLVRRSLGRRDRRGAAGAPDPNEPVVLYRDRQGRAAALLDMCCHRGAPLHLGKVVEQGSSAAITG